MLARAGGGVCEACEFLKDGCHFLERLPGKKIKEVIHSQRIFGPDQLLHELIEQSRGKPGLTVTLCRICWDSGSSREVMLGTALARDVKSSFGRLFGSQVVDILACFSIGGDSGMPLEAVAGLLHRDTLELKRAVEQLSAAGVLEVSPDNSISVHPFRLRQALVRDAFLNLHLWI